jgi:hypothetical protein
MSRRVVALVVTAALALGATACSLGDKEAQADRVVAAGKRLLVAPSVDAVMNARVDIVPVANRPINPGPPRIAPEGIAGVFTAINAPAGTAAVGIATPGGNPAILFTNDEIYQRITPKSVEAARNRLTAIVPSNFNALAATYSSQLVSLAPPPAPANAATTTSLALPQITLPTTTTSTTAAPSVLRRRVQIVREWAAFDYAAIPKHDKTKHAGSIAINPVDLLRLSQGVLAGSIKRRTDEAGLVRYDVNVSRDKAERHLSEDARKILDKQFKANAVSRTVFPAKFWLDASGNLKRMQVTLRQQLTTIDRGDLTISFELSPAPKPYVVHKPGRQGTVHTRTLGELVTTVTGQ